MSLVSVGFVVSFDDLITLTGKAVDILCAVMVWKGTLAAVAMLWCEADDGGGKLGGNGAGDVDLFIVCGRDCCWLTDWDTVFVGEVSLGREGCVN